MKASDISEALNYLDDDLILMAEKPVVKKKKNKARITAIVFSSVAAAAVLFVVGGLLLISISHGTMKDSAAPDRVKVKDHNAYAEETVAGVDSFLDDSEMGSVSKSEDRMKVEDAEVAEDVEEVEDDDSSYSMIESMETFDPSIMSGSSFAEAYKYYYSTDLGKNIVPGKNSLTLDLNQLGKLATFTFNGKTVNVINVELPNTDDVGDLLYHDDETDYDLYSSKENEDWLYAAKGGVYYLTSTED